MSFKPKQMWFALVFDPLVDFSLQNARRCTEMMTFRCLHRVRVCEHVTLVSRSGTPRMEAFEQGQRGTGAGGGGTGEGGEGWPVGLPLRPRSRRGEKTRTVVFKRALHGSVNPGHGSGPNAEKCF